jgi:hypothetical protein
MITDIILTGHILAGFITTNANTIPGNKAAENITMKTVADKPKAL